MRNVNLYSYNRASEGARELCEALDIRKIRHDGSTYIGGADKTVINWGSSTLPQNVLRSRIINNPTIVGMMSNKLHFFRAMSDTDCRTPDWTADHTIALQWARNGSLVCSRTILNGHSGNGLSISLDGNITQAPLYTKYIKKKAEYRLHFMNSLVIDVQRKIRRPDFVGGLNWHIRNHDNGFVYVRNGVREALPEDVVRQTRHCIDNCGLDFGAIDVIYNDQQGQAYVLECNTAPGLSGETVRNYAEAFQRLLA